MSNQPVKPEEFVELLDKLIVERMKMHLYQTSPTMDHSVDKRSVLYGFDQRINLIKSRLTEILRF